MHIEFSGGLGDAEAAVKKGMNDVQRLVVQVPVIQGAEVIFQIVVTDFPGDIIEKLAEPKFPIAEDPL